MKMSASLGHLQTSPPTMEGVAGKTASLSGAVSSDSARRRK